jgi:hypothetical protein
MATWGKPFVNVLRETIARVNERLPDGASPRER